MAVDSFWTICNVGILASTLFTFHDYACDSEKMKIRCPAGTTVDIQWAQYGRQVPSQKMCPHVKSFWPDSGTDYPEDTNCLATTSLQIVLDKCQDQQQCRLRAVAEVFGQDPCPGTSKYLEVAYKCRPKEFRSRVTCQGEEMVLQCQRRMRLAVYSAMYGRSNKGSDECPAQPAYNTECHARCALKVVMKRCHGKRRCTVQSSDSVFGNPCHPQTPKYLSVVYTCVPRRILKEMNVENGFPYSFCDDQPQDSRPSNSQEVPWEEYGNGNHEGNSGIDGDSVYEAKPSTMRATTTQVLPGITYTVSTPMAFNDTMVTPDISPVQDDSATFITDWLHTWNFIRSNKEKFILYVILSILVGFIILLLVIIIRLAVTHHRIKKQAKLEISDPVPQTTSSTLPRQSSPDRPEDVALLSNQDMLDSSDRLEILSFQHHPNSYHRNNHYSTTPRTFGNPNNNNNAATLHSGAYGGSGIMTTSTPYTNQYRTSPNRTSTLPRYESQTSQGSRTFDNYYR